MMMNSYLYLAVVTLLVSTIDGRVFEDNSIRTRSNNNDEKPLVDSDFIDLHLESPPEIIQIPGQTVELECVVIGKPVPTIHWTHGNNPRNIINQFDSDMVYEIHADAFGRIRSRLIIEHTSASERTFTCVGRAGDRTINASTIIRSARAPRYNKTALLTSNNGAKKPRIVYFNTVLFETIGSNIILPCEVAGRPMPEMHWLDNEKKVILGQDDRLRVHSSGALMISSLKWSDMGVYTCEANNSIGKDSIETFVYPLNGDLE